VSRPRKTRKHAQDLQGASRLLVHATQRVTEVVESMHTTIAGGPKVLGTPLSRPARLVNGLVYGGVRGVTRLVGGTLEAALRRLGPLLGESAPGPEREALLAALNGVVGDHLVATGNPLAVEACLRSQGQALRLDRRGLRAAFPAASGTVLVLVHGSSMNDLQWLRNGHDHGAALARDLGLTPVYAHYNSGLHVSENGRLLDALLERLVERWPVPVQRLVLVGHSMGGLVSRSACALGEGRRWRHALGALACLGTPHHGAPLEALGSWVGPLLGVSRYSAPLARLARLRSAGVTDLRFGNVLDQDWEGQDRFAPGGDRRRGVPLPEGVACFALAATTAAPGRRAPQGDGLVSVESALGQHPDPALALAFPEGHRWVGHRMRHLDLLDHPEVYATLRGWLSSRPSP
jgi:pimeloyl-ACP methyl ester carboxylesterase